MNLATGERTSKRVKMAEAFSPIAIGASILFLLYIIFARDGEGWQLAAVLIAPSFCWKWWARLMKWYHHD